MTKRVYWNTESFKNKVKELTNGEYELLGEYEKTHTKTRIKHLKCGYEFEMAPHSFLVGQRCPKCKYKSSKVGGRKSYDRFKKEVQELTNNEYDVLPPYKNNKTKVEFIHLVCSSHFKARPDNFLNGTRCPVCAKKHGAILRTMTNDEFIRRSYSTWGNEYTILSNYINSDTLVKVKHNSCGSIYMTRPADFLRGHGCLKCSYVDRSPKIGVHQRTPLSDVKKSIKNILGDQYVVLTKDSDYKGNRQHISIKHLVCGNVYKARYSDIQQSHTGCPYCSKFGGLSSGEQKVSDVLKYEYHFDQDKDFYYGYVIPDLKYKNNLHFDFWLPKQRIAIEYDGKQHYISINYFGGYKALQQQKKRDQLKNQYCKDNNITLIRIPYTISTKKKIKAILSKFLSGPRQ